MDSVGALILEYAPGQPLSDLLPSMDDETRWSSIVRLSKAVRHIHEKGEFHGKLTPENVLINRDRNSLRMIDLGYLAGKTKWEPGKYSPEHHPEAQLEVGAPGDIYMFALHFLSTLRDPAPELRELTASCLNENPNNRPSIQAVCQVLDPSERLVGVSPGKSGPSRSRLVFSRLAPLAAAMLIITLAWFYRPRRVAEPHQSGNAAIAALFEERRERPERAAALSATIAETRRTRTGYTVRAVSEAALSAPLAVFAFKARPILLGEDYCLEIGEWITLDGEIGYVSDIDSRGVDLHFGDRGLRIDFGEPDFEVFPSEEEAMVIIWPRENNLTRLVANLPKLSGILGEDQAILGLNLPITSVFRSDRAADIQNDTVYGLYETDSLYGFVQLLSGQLSVQNDNGSIRVSASPNQLPIHYRFEYINTKNKTLQQLCETLSRNLGIPFEIESASGDQPLKSQRIYNASWQEVLMKLDIQWQIQKENDAHRVLLKKAVDET